MTFEMRLLIIEDDVSFAKTLRRSFERRDYEVLVTSGLDETTALLETWSPNFAVVDLKLTGVSGLSCVEVLHQHDPDMLIVVLTGFASIPTAVAAIKLGACQYLAKPSNTEDIIAAFSSAAGNVETSLTHRPTSIKTLEWERIHQTLVDTNFNISESARRLGLHRRTLVRKLEKRQVN